MTTTKLAASGTMMQHGVTMTIRVASGMMTQDGGGDDHLPGSQWRSEGDIHLRSLDLLLTMYRRLISSIP